MEEDNRALYIFKDRVKFFISTKAELLEEKVNNWIEETEKNNQAVVIQKFEPIMSYTTIRSKDRDTGAYMIGCMIHYLIEEEIDGDLCIEDSGPDSDNFGLNFPS